MIRYIAFLRGINVSGHHKVPMAELRKEMEHLNFKNVVTVLNSGNIVFDAALQDVEQLEETISTHLEKVFGFPIPVLLRKAEAIRSLLERNPFKDETLTKDIRWYISFLGKDPKTNLPVPWASDDGSFKIIEIHDNAILGILDLSMAKTPKAMEILEKHYGKQITTRNWNTIKRLEKKL